MNKIVWLIPNIDVSQASVRLRCLYIAKELENRYGHESVFCEKIKETVAMIEKNCTLVIAKHLSGELISVLAKARELDCRIIYDVTDNITDDSYKGNNYRINIYLMKIILELSDIIMVPTSKLKETLINKLKDTVGEIAKSNLDKFKILPDIAESQEDFKSLFTYLKDRKDHDYNLLNLDDNESTLGVQETLKERGLLWFGNAYSPTSNMGIGSLIPSLPEIKSLQKEFGFKLIVCTPAMQI